MYTFKKGGGPSQGYISQSEEEILKNIKLNEKKIIFHKKYISKRGKWTIIKVEYSQTILAPQSKYKSN